MLQKCEVVCFIVDHNRSKCELPCGSRDSQLTSTLTRQSDFQGQPQMSFAAHGHPSSLFNMQLVSL